MFEPMRQFFRPPISNKNICPLGCRGLSGLPSRHARDYANEVGRALWGRFKLTLAKTFVFSHCLAVGDMTERWTVEK